MSEFCGVGVFLALFHMAVNSVSLAVVIHWNAVVLKDRNIFAERKGKYKGSFF